MRRTGSSACRGRCWPITPEELDYSRIAGRIQQKGPVVDVKVHLHRDELERYRWEGLTAPLPYPTHGVLDTGAERTCLRQSIVEALSLEPVTHTVLQTASDEDMEVAVYYVTLQLAWKQERPPDPISVRVLATPKVLGGEVLVGLDVLRLGKFVLYGPDSRYELFLQRTDRSAS